MDTPIKLTYYSRTFNDDGTIRTEYPHFAFLDLSSEEPQFSFYETDNISVVFEFAESECEVQIETAETGEMIALESGQEYELSRNGIKEFYPGYFDLLIKNKPKCLEKRLCFFVRPKSADMETVLFLRSFVNDFYDGLSLDLEKKRRMAVEENDQISGANSFTGLGFLLSGFSDVMNYANRYVNSRHEQLTKKDLISPKMARISPKSIRWLVKKGYTKNKDLQKPQVLLTSKPVFTMDNEQNRIFKSHVLYWHSEIKRILDEIKTHREKTAVMLDEINANLPKLKTELQALQSISQISKSVKKRIEGKVKDSERKADTLSKLKTQYDKWLLQIRRYNAFIENILFNTWVSSIHEERNIDNAKVSNVELLLLKEKRDRYIGIKRRVSFDHRKKTEFFAEKGSPKLFETFLYILLIDILRECGYEVDFSLNPVEELMFDLSSESKMTLNHPNRSKCEIFYDKYIEDASYPFATSDYCSINSLHCRPDFVLSFIDEYGELKKTLVIDAKWRRFSNIYNIYGDTDVMLNLKDYLNLGYYDAEEARLITGAITKVVAIYPDHDEKTTDTVRGMVSFCGLKICKEIKQTKNYSHLQELIEEFAR